MGSLSLFEIVVSVLKSWQVIAATIVIILFIYLVLRVTRKYHRPSMKKTKIKKDKSKSVKKTNEETAEEVIEDDLGLEE